MPYKDTVLKQDYQKRTATPYMKEWRDKNRVATKRISTAGFFMRIHK